MVLREVMKKCRYLWVILIVFGLILFNVNNYSYARGKFVELNFRQEDNNQPVALNEEEVFFAGGWNGINTNKINSAKKYNIKSKKIIPLNSTMNSPRNKYGALKYDNNHVLIAGGYCIGDGNIAVKDCTKNAEIYNIKENKFSKVKDLVYSFSDNCHFYKTGDNFLLVNSYGIQLFNTKNHEFVAIHNFNNSKNITFNLDSSLLGKDNIFIWGTYAKKGDYGIFKKAGYVSYIYNIKNQNLERINIDNELIFETAIPLDEGILFWTGNDKGGRLAVLDSKTRKFSKYTKTKFGTSGSDGKYLYNGEILLAGGCISEPDYWAGKYLLYAAFDINKNQFLSVKISEKALYRRFIVPINKNNIFLSGYEVKPL